MEAAVMQIQQVDECMAGPPAREYMSGEETDDESIDIINSTPDPEATSQQNGSAAAFSQFASEQPTDAATVKQQALPEPQQLPAPQLEHYVLSRAVQPDQEAIPDSPSETAAEVSGSASGRPQEDWSDGDAPLASMRSQDMSAPHQQPGIAAQPSQQQQAESKSKEEFGAGTPRKQGPPALRQILPAPSANGALSRKRSLEQENGNRSDTSSSSDDEDARSAPGKHHQANGAARKKRRNVLPVIRRDQRCGKCRTCLNPQMKKACLTRRAEMMKDMDKKGDLPLSLLASMKHKGSAVPQKASPPQSAEEPSSEEEEEQPKDPWQRNVEALNLSRNGGLPGPKRVPLFCKVLREADNIDKRKVALKILELSRGEALTVFTHSNNGLKILGEWIRKAKASDKDELRVALQVLTLFGKLPIDIDALLVSGVAKVMRGVGKDGPQALQSPAKQLVKNWKSLLPAGPAAAAEKRPAEASGVVKQERASKAPKADPRKGPGASAPPAVAKPAAEEAKSAADVAQPPSPGAAAGAAKALLVASDFSELDTPPAIVRRVAPREAPQAAKQAPESGAAQKAPEVKAEGASTSAAAAAAPSAAAASSANAPASSAAPKTLTPIGLPSQQRTTVTVSIGAPRPSFGAEPSVGFTETRLGGPRPLITDQRSANERAAAAAAKIADPVEDPNTSKRVKRKSVSWADDKSLQSVRLFSMHEPCDYVGSGEAVAHEEVLPVSEHALHASRPAGFASAARHEHEHEAAALRKLQEEVHETDVAPELEWCEPPECVLWYDSADNPQQKVEVRMPGTNESGQAYGSGQFSQEKPVREAYGHLHPNIHFGPGGTAPKDWPEELPSAQQRPVPGQPPSVPAEVPPKPAQPQPEPEPVLPPPPSQQQPVQAPGAGIIVNGLHINPVQLQQLLASVGQGGIQLSQPQGQVPPQQQLPTQLPIQPQPSLAPFQLPAQQPPQLQPQQQPLQQQRQWNAPPQQPPQQQAPPQGQVPAPVSLPAPGGTHPLHPRRQQQNAPARKTSQAPAHAQQHMGQPQPGQHSVSQSTKKPVTLKPPGLAQQQLKPVPVVLPTPGQQGLPGPPQRQSGQPQYQGRPRGQQQQSPGYQQNPRPPTLQPPAPQQPHQGQIRPVGQGRGPPPRGPPPVQHPAPGKGARPQRPPRHQPQSSALCTFFNTPKGCRKGDQCRFVHERR